MATPGRSPLKVRFSDSIPGGTQPLLTTGPTGEGDIVFVRYEASGKASICVDHWGTALMESTPFRLEPGSGHVLTLSLGSLYPPEGTLPPAEEQGLRAIRGRVQVDVDGTRVLDCDRPCYPSLPEWLTIGANFIGGSSVGTAFYGKIEDVSQAPLAVAPR